MARILAVGIAVLDLVHEVAHFPAEDEEMRAIGRRNVLGGNAANTLQVLAQFGHACELAATLAADAEGVRLRGLLEAAGVCTRHVHVAGSGDTFNAGLIHALMTGRSPADALDFACRLAGFKVGRVGYAGLAKIELAPKNPAHNKELRAWWRPPAGRGAWPQVRMRRARSRAPPRRPAWMPCYKRGATRADKPAHMPTLHGCRKIDGLCGPNSHHKHATPLPADRRRGQGA